MKNSGKKVLVGFAIAASLLTTVQAHAVVDISHAPVALSFLDNTTDFGAAFGRNQMGNTFADKYTFSISAAMGTEAYLSSISSSSSTGLEITDFSIRTAAGSVIAHGLQEQNGAIDLWSIYGVNLTPGSYFLQVDGYVVSNFGASYGANVNLTPVPEPETYAMMLGGLAMLGALARRRQSKIA